MICLLYLLGSWTLYVILQLSMTNPNAKTSSALEASRGVAASYANNFFTVKILIPSETNELSRSWTKCLKNQPCDVIKMRNYPSIF